MPDTPITEPRTLRCANASLYAGFTCLVWGAAAYVVFFRGETLLMQVCAALACLVSLLWGGFYVLLRYEVDATGITRRVLGKGTRINWADLTCARLTETRTQETASAVLHLETPGSVLELGSDLLPLESVLCLAREIGAEVTAA